MSEMSEIKTVDITPTRQGIEHMARLFSQEIDQANETIAKAESVQKYLEGEEAFRELKAFPFEAFPFDVHQLVIEGLDLLIEQEAKRTESLQEGLDECNRVLSLEQTEPTSKPEPKVYVIRPGDRLQVKSQLGSGQTVKPLWVAGQWVTVIVIGRSTLTVQTDDGKPSIKLRNSYFDLKTHQPGPHFEPTAVKN